MTPHPTDNAPVHELLAGTTPEHTPTPAPELIERVSEAVERVLTRRIIQRKLDGHTLDAGKEIAAAIAAMQPAAGEVLPNGLPMASQRELYVQVQRQGWENQKLAAQLATQAADVARLRVINAGLVEAMNALLRAPAGVVPSYAEPFYNAQTGAFDAQLASAEEAA